MRKAITIMLSAVLMTFITSCNNKEKTAADSGEKALSYETMTVKQADDSLGIMFKFVVDFPTDGPDSLVNEIKKNIFCNLGDSACTDLSESSMERIAKKFVEDNRQEVAEIKKGYDGAFVTAYTNEGSIKIVDNTYKYVTYNVSGYLFTGGAHGMPYKSYFTISKESNRTLGFDDIISADKKEELKGLIMQEITDQYYKGERPNWDDEIFKFALPSLAPGITTDGIVFCYGAYEIDCFAAGMPFCVIPFEEISEYMTPEAKALIE